MQFVSSVRKVYHTLRHVKPVQVSYRLKYGLKRIHSLKKVNTVNHSFSPLSMLPLPTAAKFIEISEEGIDVSHLNKTITYKERVQWNDLKFGRLWNYHLQYTDFLKQNDLSADFRAELVLDLYRWLETGRLKPEPYPASLRIMNVIRFLSENHEEIEAEPELIEYLYSELHFLTHRLEYHLLGNHLMENAFALLMGGIAFDEREWIHTAETIFDDQIPEQILEDGAHFERSPMYHLIILFRFLEAIRYLPTGSKLSTRFFSISQKMLGWIDQMSFKNGDLAHFNDSTEGQSYSKKEIVEMAKACNLVDIPSIRMTESGFRKFTTKKIELLIDASGVEPSYQPAHAHADSLSFVLQIGGKTIITDPGVSTYEQGERRNWERSTQAHNTVTYNGQNTADVWSRFRVGRRPEVSIREQTASGLEASLHCKLSSGDHFHHRRNFKISEEFIEVNDEVNLDKAVEGRLYLDPGIKIKRLTNHRAELANGVIIVFNDVQNVRKLSYHYSMGFNSLTISNVLEYNFIKQSSLKIIAPQI